MARRADGEFPGARKIQQDTAKVDQFSQLFHGANPNVPSQPMNLRLAKDTLMIVKPMRVNWGI
jgi:hypothetical protein